MPPSPSPKVLSLIRGARGSCPGGPAHHTNRMVLAPHSSTPQKACMESSTRMVMSRPPATKWEHPDTQLCVLHRGAPVLLSAIHTHTHTQTLLALSCLTESQLCATRLLLQPQALIRTATGWQLWEAGEACRGV